MRRRVQFGSNYVYIFQNVLQTYLEFPTFLPLEGLNYPTAEFMRNVTQHDCENTIFWLPVSTAWDQMELSIPQRCIALSIETYFRLWYIFYFFFFSFKTPLYKQLLHHNQQYVYIHFFSQNYFWMKIIVICLPYYTVENMAMWL